MLDRTETTRIHEPSPAASRRIFRSKVDTIRPTYGFEDVSLAPGTETVEPSDVDLAQTFAGLELRVPILASAMDAVVDARFAGVLSSLGGLAVINLEGVQARYDDPDALLERIATAPDDEVHGLLADAYQAPIREDLIARRIDEIHAAGSPAAVAATPGAARRFGPFCAEQGADLFLVQSQVSSARHLASGYDPLSLAEFTRFMPIPVAVGNTTSAEAAFQLMEQGAAAVFVGVGPGAACTTREVLGIGVPQVTAISDVAAARDAYYTETGRYVPVVADGGMRRGGELAKAVAAGADALMLGSPLARAEEAPGRGTNWGMAAPSPTLPRGTRIKVGTAGTLERILFGPAQVTDGSENLVGALRQSMAALGARTIRDMQAVEADPRPVGADRGEVLAARPLSEVVASRGSMEDELVAAGRYARLQTRGRVSGLPRVVTIGFVEERDGAILLAARAGAHWADNLLADPRCVVTVGERSWPAVADELDGPEFARAIREHILRYGTPAEMLGHGPAFRLRPVAA